MLRKEKSLLSVATLLVDASLGTAMYAGIILAEGLWTYPGAKASAALVGLIYFFIVFNKGTILFKKNTHFWQIPLLVLRNCIMLGVFATLILYVSHAMILPVGTGVLYLLTLFLLSASFRLSIHCFVRVYRAKDEHCRRVVLVGGEPSNQDLYEELANMPALGYKVVGYFDFHENGAFSAKCQYLGTPQEVKPYLAAHKEVEGVYCSLPSQNKDVIRPIIRYCVDNMVEFFNVPSVRNYLHNRMSISFVGNTPVLSLYENPLSDVGNRMIKRLFDIAVSLTFLCTVFPFIFIIVAIITQITMPGPVFFRQKRNGLNGKVFYCLKFRSMKVNDDADRLQATKNDPRKTKWGNIMRKTNIDELPQFVNVLMGDMSLVGPRPHMLKHTDEYSRLIDKYMIRHLVKPGITGWSQVTGFRGETKELWQMEGRVIGDIYYIEHWSFGLDLYIMYRTIANVIRGDKAAY